MTNPYKKVEFCTPNTATSGSFTSGSNTQAKEAMCKPMLFPNSQMFQQPTGFEFSGTPFFCDSGRPNSGYGGYGGYSPDYGGYSPSFGGKTPGYGGKYGGYAPSFGSSTLGGNQQPEQEPMHKIDTAIIEVGVSDDGTLDDHARSVKEIYQQNNPAGRDNVTVMGIGLDNSTVESIQSKSSEAPQLRNQQALNEYIDRESTDALKTISARLSELTAAGEIEVVNASLGYSRNNIYENVLVSLTDNPQLGQAMGLSESDISAMGRNKEGQILVTDQVSNAVVKYVDGRMDRPGSAYQASLKEYQDVTRLAAERNMTVVVAAGNERGLSDIFTARKLGGDTNFLAQSDHVISVAASDDKDTASKHDDTMADFSSFGDGRYNPTLSADGVNVKTRSGGQDGTSFATPQVAATVARMRQHNPNLSFNQIKSALQGTATDLIPNNQIADGAGIMNSDQAVMFARRNAQTA